MFGGFTLVNNVRPNARIAAAAAAAVWEFDVHSMYNFQGEFGACALYSCL